MKAPREVDVEVLPPERNRAPAPIYDAIVRLLDEAFRIPGTKFRFGLDPLLGLIPGAGDTISGLLAALLLTQSLQARVPRIVIARMALNVFLNTAIGAIPFFGDAFSFWFKSNVRNQQLLRRHAGTGARGTRADWLFVWGVIAVLSLVILFMVAAMIGLAAEGLRVIGGLAR
jgi:hypothetical protein